MKPTTLNPEMNETDCNPIRDYRQQRGWTQRELARRSGFSERLIRKAEEGAEVRLSTLQVLAKTLSTPEFVVTAENLRRDPMAVAQMFVRGYLKHRAEVGRQCAHLFHTDIVMAIHADPSALSFAGEFHGIDGIDRMIRTAYAQFEPINEDFGKWFMSGSTVAALRQQVVRLRGVADSPELRSWLLHEYTVDHGKIRRVDTYTDAAIFMRLLELARTK
jgi:transcriptional regulator with XRE-family HTH domain